MYNSKIIGLGTYVPSNVVTNDDLSDKIPRLSKVEKSPMNGGFGFHLLYLEDRKGEFIEDVLQGGSAAQA